MEPTTAISLIGVAFLGVCALNGLVNGAVSGFNAGGGRNEGTDDFNYATATIGGIIGASAGAIAGAFAAPMGVIVGFFGGLCAGEGDESSFLYAIVGVFTVPVLLSQRAGQFAGRDAGNVVNIAGRGAGNALNSLLPSSCGQASGQLVTYQREEIISITMSSDII